MTPIRSLALAAALALTALTAPATTTVNIIGSAGPGSFNPNPVTIASGDSVAWANNDFTIHRIVLDDGSYDSGNINPGSSSSATAALTASGPYHCIIHPSMTGAITVSAPCTFSIAPTAASIVAAGASGTVTVTAGAGCAWTAVSNSGFITVQSGATGSGNGTVSYSVAANPSSSPRTGTVTIAGQTFTVSQAGAACAPITISPATLANATLGVPMSVTLTASGGSGTGSIAFFLSSGSLPPGITASFAGPSATLAGTPTVAGSYSFTLGAQEPPSGCLGSQAYSLIVLAPVPAMPPMWMAVLVVTMIGLASWSLSRRALRERSE